MLDSFRPVTVFALLGVLAAGCGKSPAAADAAADAAAPSGETAFALTSRAFAEEFKADKGAAHARYKGKWVEITGLVVDLGTNIAGESFLILEGVPEDKLHRVECVTNR